MKRFAFLISFSVAQFLFVGCKKEGPPIGYYKATFYETSPNPKRSFDGYITISESPEDIVIIDFDTLFKEGKKIEGTLRPMGGEDKLPTGQIDIKGEWSKPFNDDRYLIKGAYIRTYYLKFGHKFTSYGVFEIETVFIYN
jgi:hypothetical protein